MKQFLAMPTRLALLACAAFMFVAAPMAARAESLSATDILGKLKIDKKPATRSLGAKPEPSGPAYSAEDTDFIKSMPTRGLKIQMKEKVSVLIDTKKPPRLDIEIQFDFNSDVIRPQSLADLNALGTALLDPSLSASRIVLNGHTDAKGSNDYNMDLSERRAIAVRDYLLWRFPIDEHRLIAIGFGEERLRNTYDPNSGENRRVEVVNLGS